MTDVVAYFDGECQGNEQPDPNKRKMRAAFVLGDVNRIESVVDPNGGPASNNTAEYLGLIMLLDEIFGRCPGWADDTKFIIYGDSKLVVEQMRSVWTVKKPHLQQLKWDAEAVMGGTTYSFEFQWVPRDQNPAGRMLEATHSNAHVRREFRKSLRPL